MNAPAPGAGATPLAVPATAVPADLLGDGEIVILAVKPSPWFVVLASWQVLAVAIVVPLLVYLAVVTFGISSAYPAPAVFWVCGVAALARLLAGCFQWAGRLYVLTNLRVMRILGTTRPEVAQCLLKEIRAVNATATTAERMLSLGSLSFETTQGDSSELSWLNIVFAEEARQMINDAIGRAR